VLYSTWQKPHRGEISVTTDFTITIRAVGAEPILVSLFVMFANLCATAEAGISFFVVPECVGDSCVRRNDMLVVSLSTSVHGGSTGDVLNLPKDSPTSI